MPLYKYTSNKDPNDYTAELVPDRSDPSRRLRVGEEGELSEAEYEALKDQVNLRKVGESEGEDEQKSDDSDSATSSAAASRGGRG